MAAIHYSPTPTLAVLQLEFLLFTSPFSFLVRVWASPWTCTDLPLYSGWPPRIWISLCEEVIHFLPPQYGVFQIVILQSHAQGRVPVCMCSLGLFRPERRFRGWHSSQLCLCPLGIFRMMCGEGLLCSPSGPLLSQVNEEHLLPAASTASVSYHPQRPSSRRHPSLRQSYITVSCLCTRRLSRYSLGLLGELI